MSGKGAPEAAAISHEPQHTDPKTFLVKAVRAVLQGGIPALAGLYSTGAMAAGVFVILPVVLVIFAVSFGLSALAWWRFTYVTGPEDIRVEQGLIGRSARSVPYERIQDVSIEEAFLPRLFGLAEVKFETGAGGKEEVTLSYLSRAEGERLRALVRERRDGEVVGATEAGEASDAPEREEEGELLFQMSLPRIFTFGLFEFSLVIFAVLLGVAQQFDFLLPFDIWEWDNWAPLFEGQRHKFEGVGLYGQAIAAIAGVLGIVALGVVTGVARTVAREYGFRLERTARGFRRRRGLFNRTDVTLPVHRVQAAKVGTRLIRRIFGWYGLKFVSLARDNAGSSSHAVAPFAHLEEIWPLVRRAGIEPPPEDTEWKRPVPGPWFDDAVIAVTIIFIIGMVTHFALRAFQPEAPQWGVFAGMGVAMLATILTNYFGWRRQRHASAIAQLFIRKGALVPRMTIAPQVKLQSVEIAQGPLARWRGYATMHFGLAGGTMSLQGIPLADARRLRSEIVERIVAVDFSDLPR